MDFIKGIHQRPVADPRLFFIAGACLMLWLMVWKRELMASNAVGYGMLGVSGAVLRLRRLRPELPADRHQAGQRADRRPDLPARVLHLVLDARGRAERPPDRGGRGADREGRVRRVWVWPDLVYTELISLILCSVVLIVWSIFLKAPLEQPANRAVTPNPSKAPWYFLGLQEMLVYFDPWLAGVVLPEPDHRRA